VNHRWLGGMLTNFSTVHKRLTRLKELEELDFDNVAASGMTKKELLMTRREKDKLERTLGGLRDMGKVRSVVWIVDTNKEALSVGEARKLGIPIVAILDTNCDPDLVDYPVPGNDDAIRSVALLTRVIADAIADGLMARASAAVGDEKAEAVVAEPMPEWERELLVAAESIVADDEVVATIVATADLPESDQPVVDQSAEAAESVAVVVAAAEAVDAAVTAAEAAE